MKQQKSPAAPHEQTKPLNPRQFPTGAQTDATASREQIRETAPPVHAPRESKRPQERTSKQRTGG